MYQPEYDNLKEENQRVKKTLKMDNLKTKEKLRNLGSGDINQLMPLPPISQNPQSPAEETARDQAVSGYKPRPNRVLIKSKCLPKILKIAPLPPIGTVKLLPHPPPKPPQHPAPHRRK
ncbi:ATP synthase gamma chain [Dissostichus eleginoides]|uniref:ATP synthase gamma chain n=1 Tax=Dissostichus eleginoides TaxID=100907 RepID=A0AAD9FKM8_DISEL|nr:ATP synthase gamma chain [Dissostichus eleginoides]